MTDSIPSLPYNGTMGYAGSQASHDRAIAQVNNAGRMQETTLRELENAKERGLTWNELAQIRNWHHGQASSVLSVLHKSGLISRIKERRNRCEIYILGKYVNGRELSPYRRTKNKFDIRQETREQIKSAIQNADWTIFQVDTIAEVVRIIERLDLNDSDSSTD